MSWGLVQRGMLRRPGGCWLWSCKCHGAGSTGYMAGPFALQYAERRL